MKSFRRGWWPCMGNERCENPAFDLPYSSVCLLCRRPLAQAFPPTNERGQGDGDGRPETGDDHEVDDDDSSDNRHGSSGWCRGRLGEHDPSRALSPSGREGGTRPAPPLPSVARPWTVRPQSCKDRRKIAPARPHSAAGVMGRRSGGAGMQLAGAGKTWSREISERTAPPRPTSAPGGGKPHQAEGGGVYAVAYRDD